MFSNDEDLKLFLEEFGRLLNKYHHAITSFSLRRISDFKIVTGGFSSLKGDGVLKPEYYTLTEKARKIIDDEDKNEN
jgi:hypothetical protein